MTFSSPTIPSGPRYRRTLFYGPVPVEHCPGSVSCTFNVKKRTWKAGVQIVVELTERQIAWTQEVTAFESWLTRILSDNLGAERLDYECRARDLFVQRLCALKLDLAMEAGLRQDHSRIPAESFEQELAAAVHVHKDRLRAEILAELDLAGYDDV
jgi:hypothetical protein